MEIVRNTNRLIHETSPYLLQHAHNPVNWFAWGQEAFDKAKKEDKLILISIGYSSCHWCHVMENESFEDENIAALMNENYVCIKVDREERPDVDQVYMDAVHLLTGSGGWPLNCFTMPDGKPVYGGTYFPKKNWETLLIKLKSLYQDNREEILRQSLELYEGISLPGISISIAEEDGALKPIIENFYSKLYRSFDTIEGGFKGSPKFPTPVVWNLILDYFIYTGNNTASAQVLLTLDKMAMGGIYDHLGGGFSRYSVDSHWIVPHFEKMLYDNAQLVSLYSKAYKLSKKNTYKNIIENTLLFVVHEMSSPSGGFYSSFDADSEGVEGSFYVWTKNEIDEILGEDSSFFCNIYNVSPWGNWEGKNILFTSSFEFEKLTEKELSKLDDLKKKLFETRERRAKPALDDKIITSWNSLMINAFVDAYNVLGKNEYLMFAESQTEFLLKNLVENNKVFRVYKNEEKKIHGFLDDYSFLINTLINLYKSTFDEKWIIKSKELTNYVIENFYDNNDGLFFYSSENDLPVRKKELQDSVIPSSSAVMAENLYFLARYFDNNEYYEKCIRMCKVLKDSMISHPRYYSKWVDLVLLMQQKPVEIVFTGKQALEHKKSLEEYIKPHFVIAGSLSYNDNNAVPLLFNRITKDRSLIYVCTDKVCSLPVDNVNDVVDILNKEID